MASASRPGDLDFASLAAWSGWLHDLGKYRDQFQDYLDHLRSRGKETQHAVYGAAWACVNRLLAVAFAVMGHHAGLHDISSLKDRVKAPETDACGVAATLMERLEMQWGGGRRSFREMCRSS